MGVIDLLLQQNTKKEEEEEEAQIPLVYPAEGRSQTGFLTGF